MSGTLDIGSTGSASHCCLSYIDTSSLHISDRLAVGVPVNGGDPPRTVFHKPGTDSAACRSAGDRTGKSPPTHIAGTPYFFPFRVMPFRLPFLSRKIASHC
jgi:hypothetical protein